MSEDVSAIEKNYLKLITKSPFLFNGSSFYKMKEDLVAIGIDATKFVT